MKPPSFVSVVNGYWCLTKDAWTFDYISKCGHIGWHDVFKPIADSLKSKRGTVVDVGAFIGDSAIWFADHPCVTFEPQRDAFMCLQHNMPGHLHFPFPAGNGERVQLQFGEGGNMGARVCNAGEHVRTIRVDDLALTDVLFIKIDVEGWEPHVLEGAKETIARCKPLVMVEFNRPALVRTESSYADIARYFEGWNAKEVFRCSDEQWDTLYTP